MNYLRRQEGVAQLLIVGLVAIAVVVIGLAIWQAQKSSNKSDQAKVTATATPVAPSSASPTPSATSVPSDTEHITTAVRAYSATASNDTISNIVIDGANAKGSATTPGVPSGYMFIAHKSNSGEWSIIFRGQELPGKALGQQYALPSGWYSTTY